MLRPHKVNERSGLTGVQGFTPGRFKGDMRIQGEVRGEIEIPPPLLGPSGAGRGQVYLRKTSLQAEPAITSTTC